MDKARLEHLRQTSRDYDGTGNPGALLFAMALRECVAEIDRLQPSTHPAIPEEVLNLLHEGLDHLPNWVVLKRYDSGTKKAARDWLASLPVATDKAVCPKCNSGNFSVQWDAFSENSVVEAECKECGYTFEVEATLHVRTPLTHEMVPSSNVPPSR